MGKLDIFEYNIKPINCDERAKFLNRIAQLFWNKYSNPITCANESLPLFIESENIIRNAYELIETEVPLWGLATLLQHDAADNYNFTEDDHQIALEQAKEACKRFYE